MFELAGLSTFLDIFQKAFGLIEKRKDQKRRLFEDIVDPVHTELSVVVKDYHAFFRSFRDAFSQAEMRNWATILQETKKKREEIVLARNAVLGLTRPFLSKSNTGRKEDELLYYFAKAINDFFFSSDDLGISVASSLFLKIEHIVVQGKEPHKGFVTTRIEKTLQHLEFQWERISVTYGELRVFCLT